MTPERDVDPRVYRRRLQYHLRQMRESLQITQATAAGAMSWSLSKLIRVETGPQKISINDLKALLGYYGVTDQEAIDSYIEMAQNSRKSSWLSEYRGIASEVFLAFLGHEDAAARSSSLQPDLVPGLLQTDEYAAEVLRVTRGSKDPVRISRLIELRIARQERVFARTDGFSLNFILDESVVRRRVVGATAMKKQISYLIDSLGRENLTIRVIPFMAGLYRSIRVPFVVLEFGAPEYESLLYLEYPQGEALVREEGPPEEGGAVPGLSPPTTPPTYLEIFAELQQLTSEDETLRILQSALSECQ